MAEDPYRTLGVTKDSTDAEIKRAYRKLARQYHPDRNPNDTASEERFKSIQNAYDMIGSSEPEEGSAKNGEHVRAGPGFSGSRSGFDFSDTFLSSWVEEEVDFGLTPELAEQGIAGPSCPTLGQISKRAQT